MNQRQHGNPQTSLVSKQLKIAHINILIMYKNSKCSSISEYRFLFHIHIFVSLAQTHMYIAFMYGNGVQQQVFVVYSYIVTKQ